MSLITHPCAKPQMTSEEKEFHQMLETLARISDPGSKQRQGRKSGAGNQDGGDGQESIAKTLRMRSRGSNDDWMKHESELYLTLGWRGVKQN
jgi:hypothetical protein